MVFILATQRTSVLDDSMVFKRVAHELLTDFYTAVYLRHVLLLSLACLSVRIELAWYQNDANYDHKMFTSQLPLKRCS